MRVLQVSRSSRQKTNGVRGKNKKIRRTKLARHLTHEDVRRQGARYCPQNPEREVDDIQRGRRTSGEPEGCEGCGRHHANELRQKHSVPSRHPLGRDLWRLQPRRHCCKKKPTCERESASVGEYEI